MAGEPIYMMQCCRHVEAPSSWGLAELLRAPRPVEVLEQDLATDASNEAVWSPGPYAIPGTTIVDAADGDVIVLGMRGEPAGWHDCEQASELRSWLRRVGRRDGGPVRVAMVVEDADFDWSPLHEELSERIAAMHPTGEFSGDPGTAFFYLDHELDEEDEV